MNILVLGVTGMLGCTLFRYFQSLDGVSVSGTMRKMQAPSVLLGGDRAPRILAGVDALRHESLSEALASTKPDVVVNCVGLVKQLQEANDPVTSIQVNALFPHQLQSQCQRSGARLVHISTDCVFAGTRGMYREEDVPDAADLYGRSKLLGEVATEGAITLRTSIIGPEIETEHGLLQWFMSQKGPVSGYRKAVFSGMPTIELGRVIYERVLPNRGLSGLFHVAAAPIDKYSLLHLINGEYGRRREIRPHDDVRIDRSLDASCFNAATGYHPPDWPTLIKNMKAWDFRN